MASLRVTVLAAALLAGICTVSGRNIRGIGKDDKISNVPWLAQIEYPYGATCAGNIIDSTHILSAAHCFTADEVADSIKSKVVVRLGATEKNKGGEVYEVIKVDTHPKANLGKSLSHDLAVMTLAKPIKFNNNIKPIELSKEAVEPEQGFRTINSGGWGMIPNGLFKPVLQTFTSDLWNTRWCQQKLYYTETELDDRAALMCATPKSGTACAGDSGSGVWTSGDWFKKPKLFGVLHGGEGGCGMEGRFSFYVNLLSENNRDFLSQFINMKDIPSLPAAPPGENPAAVLKRERLSGGVTEDTYSMLDAVGVKLERSG